MSEMNPATAKGQTLLVLGMHRSGTSALARMVNLLGVELGPDLLPAAPDNESGFWEHRQVQFIHDRVYECLGRDWTNVSPLPQGWWQRPEIEPYRVQLREVLNRDFGKSALWGIKDPRLCAMLPLWRPLLEEMNCQAKCVLIFRNPAEVAASLAKRDGISPSRTYLLWLRSLIDCQRGSRGLERTVTSYEMILANWQQQAQRIERELHVQWPVPPGMADQAVAGFIQPASRHHQVSDQAFLTDAGVPPLIRQAYAAVLKAAQSGQAGQLSNMVEQISHELDHVQPMLARFVEDFEREHRDGVVAHNLETLRLRAQIAERDAKLAALPPPQQAVNVSP
jgi:hypothetical protein